MSWEIRKFLENMTTGEGVPLWLLSLPEKKLKRAVKYCCPI